jgi:CRISPR-associated exonuclease Cas4
MVITEPDFDNPVLLSALEHYSYCPRQCALIHREQTYDENIFTLQGNAVHEKVDQTGAATVACIRSEYGIPLWSVALGVVGKADLVEYPREIPYPVEYKHGPARHGRHADLQLCGQAMCLEEMLDIAVPHGAVYHFSSRRREVAFTPELRRSVELAVAAIRELLDSDRLPAPVADARCRNCSLIESCLPFVVADGKRNSEYQSRLFICEGP